MSALHVCVPHCADQGQDAPKPLLWTASPDWEPRDSVGGKSPELNDEHFHFIPHE